jgi:hypothetical protein
MYCEQKLLKNLIVRDNIYPLKTQSVYLPLSDELFRTKNVPFKF